MQTSTKNAILQAIATEIYESIRNERTFNGYKTELTVCAPYDGTDIIDVEFIIKNPYGDNSDIYEDVKAY